MGRLHIEWPQVAALAIVVGGIAAVLIAAPQQTIDKVAELLGSLPWTAIAGLVLAGGGAAASTMLGPVVRQKPPEGGA